jgi:3-isopropylmalate/(R)-2-methylmalate dehydratase small subunit
MGISLMRAFRRHTGTVAPLMRRDIDTDQIVPKQFLKRLERTGFGQFLFYDWRTGGNGSPDPSFVLNQARYRGASILLAGANFGCGSSREHAAWALQDYGFVAVVAPSFADIFRANAVTNGVLPLALPEAMVLAMARRAESVESYALEIDLEQCRVRDTYGLDYAFSYEEGARQRLLEGLDDIARILKYERDIARYEAALQGETCSAGVQARDRREPKHVA